ncbi:MAG TPA: argininosuccinate lyase [Thermoplasmata archaeon]|nr:argininosuccinate lyase [Thermoplasmata archaeon]
MAVIVESKGGAGAAPPSYVQTPAWRFLASLPVDRKLARHDIAGSLAHVGMLGEVGILTVEEAGALAKGLHRIHQEMEAGTFPWREDLEDVHTNVEVRLTEILGPLGAKVHTARSRNDQVALDERLYLREAITAVQQEILRLQLALLDLAEAHAAAPMPGYTHLQRAQPVTVGHHLLAHFWRLSRDHQRLSDTFARANVSPLGAGALAGSTLPIDPVRTAHRLGFAGVFENSIDAVSDRDYFAEFLFDLSLLAVHLSSLGEEIVLWASQEVAFVRPVPELGSGSSLMPQKRNPDVAELARGKAGRVIGDLVSLLATLKSLPLAYNRDLQEDKAPVFDAVDHVLATLDAFASAVSALEFDEARLEKAASDPRILAGDLAEYLVSRGVPFREAHETVARFFRSTEKADAKSLRAFDPHFGDDVAGILDVRASLARRTTHGGPSPDAVKAQIARAHDAVGLERYSQSKHAESVELVDRILKEES